MAERIRNLVDEIPLWDVQRDSFNVLPVSVEILVGRNPKKKLEIKLQLIGIKTENSKRKITQEKYEVRTAYGIFCLIYTHSTDSWSLNSLELEE